MFSSLYKFLFIYNQIQIKTHPFIHIKPFINKYD